ncbi:hypothetical protein CBL_07942 [Carabus blaptoides fortunei]
MGYSKEFNSVHEIVIILQVLEVDVVANWNYVQVQLQIMKYYQVRKTVTNIELQIFPVSRVVSASKSVRGASRRGNEKAIFQCVIDQSQVLLSFEFRPKTVVASSDRPCSLFLFKMSLLTLLPARSHTYIQFSLAK